MNKETKTGNHEKGFYCARVRRDSHHEESWINETELTSLGYEHYVDPLNLLPLFDGFINKQVQWLTHLRSLIPKTQNFVWWANNIPCI